jgi:hypothetical protein
MSPWALFFAAVLVTAPIETLLGQILPIEIVRRLRGNRTTCVVVSALVFSGGHYLNSTLIHAISTLVVGAVLALGYVLARPQGVAPAFVAATTTHAMHNFVLLFVLAPLFPQWA